MFRPLKTCHEIPTMATSGISICWRGPPGSGKHAALQQQLQLWAKSIGQIYCLKRQTWNAPLKGGEDNDDDEDEDATGALLPMEVSILHTTHIRMFIMVILKLLKM